MTEGGKLTVHRGAEMVDREGLKQYVTPPATETFKPIGHSQLVEVLTQVMQDRGLFINREQFAVQNHRLFGVFDLEWQKMEEYGAAVGFRHANDKSMPIVLAVGARVWLCDNLSYLGELITVRKHTAKLDIGEEMDRAMYRYMQGWRKLKEDIEVQKETLLEDRRVKTLIYEIFQQKIVPLRLFPRITAEYQQVYKTTRTDGWWLHNLITTHIKTLTPASAFRATARLGKFFAAKF